MTAVYRVYKDNTLIDNYITDLTSFCLVSHQIYCMNIQNKRHYKQTTNHQAK